MSQLHDRLTHRPLRRSTQRLGLALLTLAGACSSGGGGGGGAGGRGAPLGGVGSPCTGTTQCETGLYCYQGTAPLGGLCTMNCTVPQGANDPCALKYPNTACLVAGVCGLQCGSGLTCPTGTSCTTNSICGATSGGSSSPGGGSGSSGGSCTLFSSAKCFCVSPNTDPCTYNTNETCVTSCPASTQCCYQTTDGNGKFIACECDALASGATCTVPASIPGENFALVPWPCASP